MKRAVVLVILGLCAMGALAQKNFVKGGVITSQKDTLRGYIDDQEWVRSPSSCVFKANNNAPEQTFNASEITGFFIEKSNELYLSKTFSIEKLSRDINKTNYGSLDRYRQRSKNMQSKTVFVRPLTLGKLSLFLFTDFDNEVHFLVEENNKITPLVYHHFMADNYSYDINEFQNQLRVLCQPCETMSKYDFASLPYQQTDLLKTIRLCNACLVSEIKPYFVPNTKYPNWEIGLLAGLGISSVTYSTFPQVADIRNTSPQIGLFVNYVVARSRGRFVVQNEILNYGYRGVFTDTDYNGISSEYNFKLSYLSIKNLLKYKFYAKQTSAYVFGGIGNGFVIGQEGSSRYTNFGSGSSSRNFPESVRKHEESYVVGLGLSRGRVYFEASIIKGTGFSPFTAVSSASKQFSFLVKYRIL